MSFTENQLKAINIRNKNTLVSAAAGSGKTTVLAERIINLIVNDKINVDNLLVVTFTKDSAEEMKQRILKRLNKELENKDDPFLIEQLTRINKAQISTIDAFCSKVVKTHFKVIDIDPNFRIGDKGELDLLIDDAIESFFEPLYEENNQDFINLVDAFTKTYSDKKFIDTFLSVYNKTQNLAEPTVWLKNAYKEFEIYSKEDFYSSNFFQKILSYSKDLLEELNIIYDFIKFISTGVLNFETNINVEKSLEKFLNDEFMIYKNLISDIENNRYDIFIETISNLKYPMWNRTFLKDAPDLKEEIKGLRDLSKKLISDVLIKNFFYKPVEEMIQDINSIYPTIKSFCNLIIDFDSYLLELKKEKNIFTFSDIAHFCLNILKEDSIMQSYKQTFKEIIIDEYQDSNSIQETLLSSISENNRFMVGDIKQCIYKFRQANPSIFNEKYIGYKNATLDGSRIDLNANFRSNKYVVDAINIIFENLMCNGLGEVDYNDDAKLYKMADFKEDTNQATLKNCSLNIIDCNLSDEVSSQELIDIASDEMEATFVAQKISELFKNNTKVFDFSTQSYRPIEYKDIVILMRNKSSFDTFNTVLANHNIPVYSESSNNFYDYTEIKTILNILNVLVNPLQDFALIGTMYSPIFNFLANELLEIKLFSKQTIFFKDLLYFIENTNNTSLKSKCKDFIEKITKWQNLSKTLSINELLSYIYEDSSYYNYLGLLENGSLRQANLLNLLEKALSFESTNLHGLFNFINYINKFKLVTDEAKASILSKSENVVKIMTIHKSKGLEFPVVFLSNLSKQFSTKDNKEQIIFDEDYMLGISIFEKTGDLSPRKTVSSIHKNLIKYKTMKENYSEEMRILYVALTRAKENLILTGTIKKDVNKTLSDYENLIPFGYNKILPNAFIYNGQSNKFLSWIYCALKNFDKNNIWDINIIPLSQIFENSSNLVVLDKIEQDKYDLFNTLVSLDKSKTYSKDKIDIYNNLNWQYKDNISQKINTAMSVTEIKKMYQPKYISSSNEYIKQSLDLPKFYNTLKEEFENIEIGSIYHKILEHLDFKIQSQEELNNLFSSLITKNILEQKEILSIDSNKILTFLKSSLVKRINLSPIIKREEVFTIGLDAKEIYPDIEASSNTTVLVNGIIDLYFEENNEIILVDYKTDKVSSPKTLKDRYQKQLEIYKKALENATNKKVKECIIYSIHLNQEIKIF